jgi:hypothetical protein
MRLFTITLLVFAAMVLTSCVTTSDLSRLDETKAKMNCISYKEGMDWQDVKNKLDMPQITPIPEEDSNLNQNLRIYRKSYAIFYTDLKETEEEGNVRFKEIVTSVEICRDK